MMYSEFVEATGCKQTEFNYNVFLKLEEIYTMSDLTKNEIYTIGKMRVDNSETEEERKTRLAIEAQVKEYEDDIEYLKERLTAKKHDIVYYKSMAETNPDEKKYWNGEVKSTRETAKYLRHNLDIAKARLTAYKNIMGV